MIEYRCATKWCFYAGVGPAVLELDLGTGERRRTLTGLRAAATCLSVLGDGRLLAAGAADCTTFIWELQTGRVYRHVIDCTMSLPDSIKHLADSFLPKSQATRMHRTRHTHICMARQHAHAVRVHCCTCVHTCKSARAPTDTHTHIHALALTHTHTNVRASLGWV